MAQLDFFLSIKDREHFIEYCFDNKRHMIPHLSYSSPSYITLKNLTEYNRCEPHTLFSIVEEKFFNYPLKLDFNIIDNKKKYFIVQREGGPTIDFFSPVFGQIENKVIGPGYIGVYPYYYKNNEKIYPDTNFKECYNDCLKFIKQNSKPFKIGKRKYWIGLNAIELCRNNGYKFLQIGKENPIDLV